MRTIGRNSSGTHRAGNILVLPFALTAERRAALREAVEIPPTATVACVAPRPAKGMRDFPLIAARLCDAIRLHGSVLIGTRGMLRTAAEVLTEFRVASVTGSR